jgi:shikimate kinase
VSDDTRRHLVLVGLMGAGKTTVGERCAHRLGRPFVDTDDLVETLAGRPVPELFATDGEAAFRAFEHRAVADACESPVPLVIGCGGGTVLDPTNRRRLHRCGFVVWLQARPDVLSARVDADPRDRPLLAAGSRPVLERLAETRAPVYGVVADVAVATDDRTPDQVADAVLEELARCVA